MQLEGASISPLAAKPHCHPIKCRNIREVYSPEFTARRKLNLKCSKLRLGVGEQFTRRSLPPEASGAKVTIADEELNVHVADPKVDVKQRVRERMRSDIKSSTTQFSHDIRFPQERVVRVADPPPHCVLRLLSSDSMRHYLLDLHLSRFPQHLPERQSFRRISEGLIGRQTTKILSHQAEDMGECSVRMPITYPRDSNHVSLTNLTQRVLGCDCDFLNVVWGDGGKHSILVGKDQWRNMRSSWIYLPLT